MNAPAYAVRCRGLGKRFYINRDADKATIPQTVKRWLTGAADQRELWALRDVSFSLPAGESLGVIGPNGAGKSTLLLLLAQILTPSTGEASVAGRTNAFFQLSAGLQGELSVRDNFRLAAALLGMPREDYEVSFDKIVAFAELQDYLDARLADLSTGLAARVPFAAAVHADLDVLLIDEMLAVGDVAFQEKCKETFRRFQRQGKTLLVVSHNLDLIRGLCGQTLYLNGGRAQFLGPTPEAVERLLRDLRVAEKRAPVSRPASPGVVEAPAAAAALEGVARALESQDERLRSLEISVAELAAAFARGPSSPQVSTGAAREHLTSSWKSVLSHAGPLALVDSPVSAIWAAIASLTSPHARPALAAGDEVIVTACNRPGVAQALHAHGLRPVLVDVEGPSFNLSPSRLEAACTPGTRAVVVSHLLGSYAPCGELHDWCRRRGLWLVEINPNLGVREDGRPLGLEGDIGVIAQWRAKSWGLVVAADPALELAFRRLTADEPLSDAWDRPLIEGLGRRPLVSAAGLARSQEALEAFRVGDLQPDIGLSLARRYPELLLSSSPRQRHRLPLKHVSIIVADGVKAADFVEALREIGGEALSYFPAAGRLADLTGQAPERFPVSKSLVEQAHLLGLGPHPSLDRLMEQTVRAMRGRRR